MKRITILLPCYNEQDCVGPTLDAIRAVIDNISTYEWELLFVDDGSTDNTRHTLLKLREQDPRINVLSLSRNFGKEAAMLAGLDYAGGDAAIIMDADGQHDPELLPRMLSLWEEDYDDVYARCINRGNESKLRKFLTRKYYGLLQRLSKVDILPNVGDFRLLDRKCVNALRQLRESERYTKGLYCWIGFNKVGFDYSVKERNAGKSTFSLGRLFKLSIDGITSYTTAPLRISTVMGVAVSLLAFIYMLYTIFKTIVWGEPVRGYPTLTSAILFLSGVQLLSLGIIGEYIGRIFIESKRRPPYIANTLNDTPIQ